MPITDIEYVGLRSISPLQRPLLTCIRGQQLNNTQDKSVSASSNKSKGSKSKASDQRKSRQDSYKKKFGNRPHMIIPQEDFIWALDKHNSVKTLFMECWLSDPYGSHWQDLKHSLKTGSFKRAKKILFDKGLFIFEPKKSIRDGRETTHWRVLNLHGARKNDYWLNIEKSLETSEDTFHNQEDHALLSKDHPLPPKDHPGYLEDHPRSSISDQSQSQQAIPDPSETSQERLSNSSKELLETLATEKEVSDRDRDFALEEQITSASLQNENQVQSLHSFHCVTVVPDCLKKEEEAKAKSVEEQKSLGAACPQTPRGQKGKEINTSRNEEILNQEYIPNPQSEEAVVRSVAQNLAIEDQRATKEYQTTSKEAFDRIRTIFDEKKKQKLAKREANLRGDSPMSLSERQAFEQYKREVETNRKKQAEEELVDFWDF